MKLTVTEVREAKFIKGISGNSRCFIDFKYEVRTENGQLSTFGTEESAYEYIKYLQEEKKDYSKVIKEIEI